MKRFLFRAGAFVLGSVLGATAHDRAASADQMLGLVQITCAPEAKYFSIRRFLLVNPPRPPGGDYQSLLSTVESKYRFYTAIQLKAAPVECDLTGGAGPANQPDQQRRLRLRVQGFYDDQGGQAPGPRQIVNNVEVSADGKALGRLYLNAFGYMPDESDLIEVLYNGIDFWVERCSYRRSHDARPTKGCTQEGRP
jgi:hypothetical protein